MDLKENKKTALKWLAVIAISVALFFVADPFVKVAARSTESVAGTSWYGDNAKATFSEDGKGTYNGAEFTFEERGGFVKGQYQGGKALDFARYGSDKLLCVDTNALMRRLDDEESGE